jgi:hypothetical protein
MTTRDEIANWFDRGVAEGKRYMVVMCDTFDHSDYPMYFETADGARAAIKTPGSMTRFMEAYDLHADKAAQLNERRANCFAREPTQ